MSNLAAKSHLAALIASAATLLLAHGPLVAQEFDRGEALYENQCKECHEGVAHTRHKSRVGSLHDIRIWVISWSVHSNLNWSSEEIDDVADYLNKRFYRVSAEP